MRKGKSIDCEGKEQIKMDFEEFKQKTKGIKCFAVILFADIIGCSEVSNNNSIERYAYILNQFHECARSVYKSLNLHRYSEEVVEIEAKGDEVCLILHSYDKNFQEKEEDAIIKDTKDAIIFSISLKMLWRASEYNLERLENELIPRDIAIGINQGTVYYYKNQELDKLRKTEKASEGYPINLAKRIETASREGEKSKIFVSNNIVYFANEGKIKVKFVPVPTKELKGITTVPGIHELTEIEDDFVGLIDKSIKEINLKPGQWEKYERLKEMNPTDFWTDMLLRFRTISKRKEEEVERALIIPKIKTEKIERKSADDYYDEAYKNYLIGNYEKVVELMTEIIKLNPEDGGAYYNRGNAYVNLEQYKKAIEDFNKTIELNPEDAEAYNNRGLAYYVLKQYDKAIEDCNKAVELNPELAGAYYNRGLAYSDLKQYDKAIKDYNKAIEIKPDLAVAYNNRGLAYYVLKEYGKAIENYNKAVELNPEYADAYNNRGLAYSDLKQYDKAIKDYNKAIELKPDYAEAWVNKGIALGKLGRYDEELKSYNKAIELKPDDAKAWVNKGVALGKLGRYDDALKSYDKAIELKPDYAGTWYNKACAYSLKGDKENALRNLSKAIESDAKHKEFAKKDKDFKNYWDDKDFKKIVS